MISHEAAARKLRQHGVRMRRITRASAPEPRGLRAAIFDAKVKRYRDAMLRGALDIYCGGISFACVTVSEPNRRGHWSKHVKRERSQREEAYCWSRARFGDAPPQPPLVVTLERIAGGYLDDDNLVGAMKHVRDGVADYLGINDGSAAIEWRYRQRKRKSSIPAVRITIRKQEP